LMPRGPARATSSAATMHCSSSSSSSSKITQQAAHVVQCTTNVCNVPVEWTGLPPGQVG
jgi:hypothetical protein